MLNLTKVVRRLKKERQQAQGKLDQLDAALKALSGLGSSSPGPDRPIARKRKPMSAAARKRIAAAQRARWAKWKSSRAHK